VPLKNGLPSGDILHERIYQFIFLSVTLRITLTECWCEN